ncbi:outer membrane protein assembly factor BamB family protein [Halosimplex halophilum]|uniref:outer membrane protein assembly factor BamB family protein n=1 Tax=Halosimplex halophilum TaxID=2559572 RepID=UPI00107F7989|nr:PQQ-binding-like beta-propeller repeat protein [Halosimplex halophilum]
MDRRSFCRRLAALGGTFGLAGCLSRPDEPGTATAPRAAGGTDATETATATDAEATDEPTDSDAAETTASGDAQASDAHWPTFGGDDGHTGYRPDGAGPVDGRIAWSAIGDAPTVLCPPTVADGVVYTGSAADAVHAFDAETGEARWEFPTSSYVETAPTVRDGRVYTADADGVVYALTTDGEAAWRHETEQNLHSRTLAVRDGTVYVGTAGNMPMVVSGDTDKSKAGKVLALDADSGEELWSFEGPEDWFTGPALGDGRVYVGNHTGEVFALDAASGEERWSRSATAAEDDSATVLVPPTYDDGSVYVAVHAAGRVAALDAESGEPEWRVSLPEANVKSSPAVTDDRVFVASYGYRGAALTGGETPTAEESGTVGVLSALDRADGSEDWTHETDHDFRSSPAVAGDRVYVGGGDGVLAVARDDGTERWRVTFDDYVDSSPAVAAGRLFVGSADGSLYCVAEE